MTETFCTSGSVKLAAGANVSSAITGAQYTELINQAEDALNVAAKIPDYNLVTNYAALSGAGVAGVLRDGAANHAAMGAIKYDPSGYTNIGEAITIMNACWTRYLEASKLIKEKQHTDWMRNQ